MEGGIVLFILIAIVCGGIHYTCLSMTLMSRLRITLVYFSSRINYNNILKLLALLKQLCYYYLGCYTNIHSHNKIIVLDLSQNSIIN